METFQSMIAERYGFALQVFLFLSHCDVYKCLCLSKDIKEVVEDEVTWKVLLYHLCVSSVDPRRVIRDPRLLIQINRPTNEDSIGWRINFNNRPGIVVDFRINCEKLHYKEEYLILFDSPTSTDHEHEGLSEWIAENSMDFDNMLPSNSKIYFMSPPPRPRAGASTRARNQLGEWSHSSPSSEEERSMREFFSVFNLPPASWRQAHRSLLRALPSSPLATISVHQDEVLDVSFSHDGRLLVAASRDGTFSLTQLSPADESHFRPRPLLTTKLRGPFTMHACYVKFSPGDDFLAVVSNNPHDPGGRAAVEVFYVRGGLSEGDDGFDVDGNEKFGSTFICNSVEEVSYVSISGGGSVAAVRDLTLAPSPSLHSPDVRLQIAFHMPYNLSTPWLDDRHLLYAVALGSLNTSNLLSCLTLGCLDVMTGLCQYLYLWLNGSLQLATALRLAPGKCMAASRTHEVENRPDAQPFRGAGAVYATNAAGLSVGYPQLLCVLPLSAFSAMGAPTENVRFDDYSFVDTRGAIVGIATNAGEAFHDVIVVNVRPHVIVRHEEGGEEGAAAAGGRGVLADIGQDAEIRVYCALTLQHLHTYTGHHGFTLKDCPFYIFLDVVSRPSATPSSSGGSGGRLDNLLVASGSEDHKVYVWMGHLRAPVQILDGHSEHVGAVAFNHQMPGLLATASDDATVHIYDALAH